MRRFMLIVLLLFVALPTFAQNDTVPIAEIVTTAAADESPEFTVLLAALQSADPVFLQVLSQENANVTVFAPTDAAFDELIAALGTTRQNLLADRMLLNDLLSYHVVPVVLPSESLATMNGGLLGTLLTGKTLRVSTEGEDIYVNASQVITPNLYASNGIVHVVDTVLAPAPDVEFQPTGTLADVVVANANDASPEFATLLAAAEAADPIIMAKLTGNLPYTLFAPTDAAFDAALDQLGLTVDELLADSDRLTAILSYHIVPGKLAFNDLFDSYIASAGTPIIATLLPGITLDINVQNNNIALNYANIILPDVQATNGILHVIDAVLIPPL